MPRYTVEEKANLLKWRKPGPTYKTFAEIGKLLGRRPCNVSRYYDELLNNHVDMPAKKVHHRRCLLDTCRRQFTTKEAGNYYCCAAHRIQNVTNNSYLAGNTGSGGHVTRARVGA